MTGKGSSGRLSTPRSGECSLWSEDAHSEVLEIHEGTIQDRKVVARALRKATQETKAAWERFAVEKTKQKMLDGHLAEIRERIAALERERARRPAARASYGPVQLGFSRFVEFHRGVPFVDVSEELAEALHDLSVLRWRRLAPPDTWPDEYSASD